MVATQNAPARRQRHVPLRRCVVCRESKPQAAMLRLTRDESGAYVHDARRRLGGRGTWVCRDCAADAVQRDDVKKLSRAFRAQAAQVLGLLREAARLPQGPAEERPAAVTARRDGGTDV
ncbi:MAG TPA: YlxR family protein [Trueperaceae bacterium]|nr:YlxR family protein [Trueperaceae bacterium]